MAPREPESWTMSHLTGGVPAETAPRAEKVAEKEAGDEHSDFPLPHPCPSFSLGASLGRSLSEIRGQGTLGDVVLPGQPLGQRAGLRRTEHTHILPCIMRTHVFGPTFRKKNLPF